MPLAPPDAGEVLALFVRYRSAQPHRQQVHVAADGVERRAQLVAHDGQELALRPVRGLRLRREAEELVVRRLQIARQRLRPFACRALRGEETLPLRHALVLRRHVAKDRGHAAGNRVVACQDPLAHRRQVELVLDESLLALGGDRRIPGHTFPRFGKDLPHYPAEERLTRMAEHHLGLAVDVRVAPVVVEGREGVGHGIEQCIAGSASLALGRQGPDTVADVAEGEREPVTHPHAGHPERGAQPVARVDHLAL
jgi:hypothetical protein